MDRREFLFAQAALAATSVTPGIPAPAEAATPGREGQDSTKGFPVALWLAPIEEHRRAIQEEIDQMSREHHEFPGFRAHATLCAGTLPDLGPSLKKLLEQVDHFCSSHERESLTIDDGGPFESPENAESPWSTFLVLRLALGNCTWFDAVEKDFNAEGAFQLTARKFKTNDQDARSFVPHISLVYSNSESAGDFDRAMTIERLKKSALGGLKNVTFEGVEIVMPKSDNWSDILNHGMWNVVYARQFNPPAPSRYEGLRCVVAGGQIGCDQIALEAALATPGVSMGGWCPPNRETQEENNLPPIPCKFPLRETPERNSTGAFGPGVAAGTKCPQSVPRSLRTEWNCRDSDGTLVVPARNPADVGTVWTVRFAHDYGKPVCFCSPFQKGTEKDRASKRNEDIECVKKWIWKHRVEVLNVAGPAALSPEERIELDGYLRELLSRAKHKPDISAA